MPHDPVVGCQSMGKSPDLGAFTAPLSGVTAIFLTAILSVAPLVAGDEYVERIERKRAETDREFADPESSPLVTFALTLLTQDEYVIGSSPEADVACADCGLRQRHARVFATSDGFALQPLEGKVAAMGGAVAAAASDGALPWKIGQKYRMGDLIVALQMHPVGPVLRLIRPEDPRLQGFAGLKYWPIDARYRVPAKIEPTPLREATVLDTKGWKRTAYIYGKLSFEIDGRPQKLDLILFEREPKPESKFMLIFQDPTSGGESYPACRYLYLPFQAAGEVELDFNLASNPYCAYGGGFACPLPLPGNRLSAAIAAGEKKYWDEH